MLPVIALVGRPNVGKSTLFNRLTRSRDALVADFPGLTRDRQYGFGKVGPIPYIVIDTGGLAGARDGVDELMEQQTLKALEEADRVIFLVDAREGLTAADEHVAGLVRRRDVPVTLVINKAEGLDTDIAASEFHALGLGYPVVISASHGDRVAPMMDELLSDFETATTEPEEEGASRVTVAVIGRPNVGKSTLINRLLGEERLVAFDKPGTTRDSVRVPFSRDGRDYTLVDTAGVRRRAKVHESIEKFSIVKALQAMEEAAVVIAVVDAREGITEQDVSLMGLAVERGRAIVIAINKWDGLSPEQRRRVRDELDRKLPFMEFAPRYFISALHGTGVGDLMQSVDAVHAAAWRDLPTPDLTRALQSAVEAHPPPLVRGRRIRLRYAHQGGRNPPVIVIHGNQTERLPGSYQRYLVNHFRRTFGLDGTPIRLSFRTGENPYKGRRNTLTPRQQRRRKRLMKHVKR
jgi:GTP-binding protein